MADKRIYELVTTGVRTGKFIVLDGPALSDAEKFDALELVDRGSIQDISGLKRFNGGIEFIDSSVGIDRVVNDLTFTDPNAGTVTLSGLVGGGIAPVAIGGPFRNPATVETLVLQHPITNALYEGNLPNRVIRTICNYVVEQDGPTTPGVQFRVKLGSTILLSSVNVTAPYIVGRIIFEVCPLNVLNSYVKYFHQYNNTLTDQSAQGPTSVAHGTGDGFGLYIDCSGDVEWSIETATIEIIG